MPRSYLASLTEQSRPRGGKLPQAPRKGLFGLGFGPDFVTSAIGHLPAALGLRTAVEQFGQGLYGLGRLVQAAASPQREESQKLGREALGGLGKAVAGIAVTPAELVGRHPGESMGIHGLGSQFREQGLLPTVINNLGLVAGGAGAAKAGVTRLGGAATKLGAAEAAVAKAQRAGVQAAAVTRAAEVGASGQRLGGTGFLTKRIAPGAAAEAGISGPLLRDVARTAQRARGLEAPAEAVARGRRLVEGLETAAHPYVAAASKVGRPLTRAAAGVTEGRLAEGVRAAEDAADTAALQEQFGRLIPDREPGGMSQEAAQRAYERAFAQKPIEAPPTPEAPPIPPRVGPAQKASVARRLGEIPEWAQRIAGQVPEPVRAGLERAEVFARNREVRRVRRETERFAEASRRQLLNEGAVPLAVAAAQSIVDYRAADGAPLMYRGAPVTAEIANRMVGDAVMSELEGRRMLEYMVSRGLDPTPELLDEIQRATSRKYPIPDEVMSQELQVTLDQAVEQFRGLAKEREQMLLGSHYGDRGLTLGPESDALRLTPTELKNFRRIEAGYRKISGLEADDAKVRLAFAKQQLALNSELDGLRASAETNTAAAQRALAKLREEAMPATLARAARQGTIATLVSKINADLNQTGGSFGGGTFDPHTGTWETAESGARAAVGVTGTAMPTEVFTANPAQAIAEFLDRYDAMLTSKDGKVGIFVDGETTYLDVSQTTLGGRKLSREQAVILGTARGEKSIWDFAAGGREALLPTDADQQVVASLHAKELTRPGSQLNRYLRETTRARELLEEWQTQAAVAGALIGGPGEVRLQPGSWDDLLQLQMTQSAALVARGALKSLDQVYGKMAVEARKTAALPPQERLMQQFLTKEFLPENWTVEDFNTAMRELGPEGERALNWYFENHNIVRERWGDEMITLFDEATQGPREVLVRDLVFSLLAVTSRDTSPGMNSTFALQGLTALANLNDMDGMADRLSEVLAQYRATLRADKAAGRLTKQSAINADELFKLLGAKVSHRMTDVKAEVMEVLNGHLVGDWDNEYLLQKAAREPKFLARLRREGRDIAQMTEAEIMDAGGSEAHAKIRNFYENLAHPDTSQGITLDRVMAEMLGLPNGNWAAPGAYETAANAFRALADQVSVAYYGTTGRVKPHQVQALFWVWTKNKLQQAERGAMWAAANDALGALDEGDAEAFRSGRDPISRLLAERATPRPMGEETVPEAAGFGREFEAAPETQVHAVAAGEAKLKQESLDRWLAGPAKEVADALERGDRAAAESVVTTFVAREQARIFKPAESYDAPFTGGRGAGDLAARVIEDLKSSGMYREADPSLRLPTPEAPEGGWNPHLLHQMAEEIPMGMMYSDTKTGRLTMRFLRTADPTTLVHENAHLLRQLLPEDDLRVIRESYGASRKITPPGQAARRLPRGEIGKVSWEERFVEDMITHMTSGRAPLGLETIFDKIREALTSWWSAAGDRFTRTVDPGVADVLNQYLDPSYVTAAGAKLLETPGPKELPFDKLTPRQIRDRIGARPGETPEQTLRRGKRIGSLAVEAAERTSAAARDEANAARVETAIERMVEAVAADDIPGASKAAAEAQRLERQFGSLLNKVETAGTLATKPPTWQPLWKALGELQDLAKGNPALADALSEIPETFTGFVQYAVSRGLNPVHVAHLSDTRVRALVYGKLGIGGRLVEAGTRKARAGTLDFDRSIEALVAAQTDVVREANNNAFVDYIRQAHAIPIAAGDDIPAGYVAWDPARAFLSTQREPGTDVIRAGVGAGAPRYVIPEATAKLLDRWANPAKHDYALLRGVQRITNPWRALVLTWTPRWYLNNVIGNMILATKEGVSLADWAQAWSAYRKGFEGEVGGALSSTITTDLQTGQSSLLKAPGFRAARQQGAGRLRAGAAGYNRLAAKVQRANSVVDDLSRAAVYFSAERKGFSPEHALQRAYDALVDYGDLSDVEQAYVRAAVPFYAWQKGILKQVIKFPVDHPLRAALMMQMGQLNEKLMADVPDAYKGLFRIPGTDRSVNLRPLNPFADATALVTPQGIASSLNPFVEIVARNALDAPATGFPEQYRIDELGRAMPTTDPRQELIDTLLQTPQAGAVGLAPSGRNVGGFFGLRTFGPERVEQLKERKAKSEERQYQAAERQAKRASGEPAGTKKPAGRSFLAQLAREG